MKVTKDAVEHFKGDCRENNKVIDFDKPLECDAGKIIEQGALYTRNCCKIKLENNTNYEIELTGIPIDKNLPDCYRVRNKVSEKDKWVENVFTVMINKNCNSPCKKSLGDMFDLFKSGELPEVKRAR